MSEINLTMAVEQAENDYNHSYKTPEQLKKLEKVVSRLQKRVKVLEEKLENSPQSNSGQGYPSFNRYGGFV